MDENTGKLDGLWCYLSGPMEFAADDGVGWRRKFVDLCKKEKLNLNFIDPTQKPGEEEKEGTISEDKNHQIKLQSQGRYVELREYVKKYRRLDLRFVDLSDFLVVVVDPNVHMCGTYNEIFVAEQQHKPCFFICEGGLKNLPRWLFDVVDLDEPKKLKRCNVFENIKQVIDELKLINYKKIPMSDKWVLVRREIERLENKII